MNKITKPNRKSENKAYWEKVLESHGLGIDQPLTDHSDEAGAPQTSKPQGKISEASAKRAESIEDTLRQIVDGSDSLLSDYGVKKVREIEREIPDWTLSDAAVRTLLLQSFPRLHTNETQRARAARWFRVIYLYYRMHLPRQIVEKELGVSENVLKMLIRAITKAAKGERADFSGKRTSMTPLKQPVRETGRKENGETV